MGGVQLFCRNQVRNSTDADAEADAETKVNTDADAEAGTGAPNPVRSADASMKVASRARVCN